MGGSKAAPRPNVCVERESSIGVQVATPEILVSEKKLNEVSIGTTNGRTRELKVIVGGFEINPHG